MEREIALFHVEFVDVHAALHRRLQQSLLGLGRKSGDQTFGKGLASKPLSMDV